MDLSKEERKACEGMLTTLGRLPVERDKTYEAYDESPLSQEEHLAALLLTDTRRAVLCQGWHFNTAHMTVSLEEGEADMTYTPILDIISGPPGVSLLGEKLVHLQPPHPEEVTVRVLRDVAFKNLPPLFSRYVVIKAGRGLQDRLLISHTLHGFTEREEWEAYGHLKQWEAEHTAPSMLTGLMRR